MSTYTYTFIHFLDASCIHFFYTMSILLSLRHLLTRLLVHLLSIFYFLFSFFPHQHLLLMFQTIRPRMRCIVDFGNLEKCIIAVVLCNKSAQYIATYMHTCVSVCYLIHRASSPEFVEKCKQKRLKEQGRHEWFGNMERETVIEAATTL